MSIPQELFNIELKDLGDKKIFPFHLYVYNPQADSYSPYLFANSPMTNDKFNFIEYIVERGGSLAVDKKQKRTFLHDLELEESDIKSLQDRELSELELKRLEKIKAKEQEAQLNDGQKPIYDLKNGFNECLTQDNFLSMICAAKEEIELFQVNVSHTVSLAAHLASEFLNEDNFTNRVVAISYFLTKNLDMKDEQTLADIVCAGFFSHLGITQIDHSLSHKPENEYNDSEKRKHRKHPGYSHHLLLKSGVEISDRCKNIIFQHHERYDGSGYPNQRHGDFIDILALCLGAVTHILEFSNGKITGSPQALDSVIRRLKNKTFSTGLEFEFGDKIYNNIISLLSNENSKKKEEAA